MKPLLVGEVNPISDKPEHALYPWPPNCSGERLQRLVIGVPRGVYLRAFDRVDLCVGKWSIRAARARAAELRGVRGAGDIVVLLGVQVAEAFGFQRAPYTIHDRGIVYVVLPHPSGINGEWRKPDAYQRARYVLQRAGVLNNEGGISL